MIKCSKCNSIPNENDVIGWKCNSCGKAFKVTKSKLHNINMKKVMNSEKSYINCPSCKNRLDDGNECIVWKCSCGNTNIGKLKDFEEEKGIEQEIFSRSNLIKCPECGKDISSKAKKCVHCGKVFVEEQPQMGICVDCGREVPSGAAECPHCGCPVEKEKENLAALQQVEVAGVKVTKKTKNIIVMAAIILVLCVVGCGSYKVYFDKKSERQHVEAYNIYIDNLIFAQICMLAGGSDAESLCNLTLRVWGNSIYKEKDSETDQFTREDNGKGAFYDDFNDALFNLYLDEDTSKTRKSIEENQKTVKQLIKDLQTVPEGLEKCYDTVSDLYDAYNTLTELAVNPSGNYNGYSSSKATAVSEFMSLYEKLDNQIPNKKE